MKVKAEELSTEEMAVLEAIRNLRRALKKKVMEASDYLFDSGQTVDKGDSNAELQTSLVTLDAVTRLDQMAYAIIVTPKIEAAEAANAKLEEELG